MKTRRSTQHSKKSKQRRARKPVDMSVLVNLQPIDFSPIQDYLGNVEQKIPDLIRKVILDSQKQQEIIFAFRDRVLKEIQEEVDRVFGKAGKEGASGNNSSSPENTTAGEGTPAAPGNPQSGTGDATASKDKETNPVASASGSENPQPGTANPQPGAGGSDHTASPSDKETNPGSPISGDEPSASPAKKRQPRPGQRTLPRGTLVHHKLKPEDKTCTGCGKSMVIDTERQSTYVIAVPLLVTTTHITECCRCVSCGTHVQATRADTMEKESIGKYHASAIATFASLRYLHGVPSYRLEQLSSQVGIPVPDSTQWSLLEQMANHLRPFALFLERQVANASVQYTDDTNCLVLSLARSIREQQEQAFLEGKNPDKIRSGIHTSNITGEFTEGQIVLYKTGLHHNGEVLEQILRKRTIQEQLIIMSDAASTTLSKLDLTKNPNIESSNCNSHGIRKFKEIAQTERDTARLLGVFMEQGSDDVQFFLSHYVKVFDNDQKTKTMDPATRLAFHQQHSLPLMIAMQKKATELITEKKCEPNGTLGKTCNYFLNHFNALSAFCRLEKAPICNNTSERALKCIIRHRKNSLFFQTQVGAKVGDIFASLLVTAKVNNINPIEYVRDLFIHRDLCRQNPHDWLPWNYKNTIEAIKQQNTS